MGTIEEAIATVEAEGYFLIPRSDVPAIVVDEEKLLAKVDGMDALDFAGRLNGRSVGLGAPWFDNHSEEYEYRRVVAHLAMLLWYRENLEHEKAVSDRAREILRDKGIENIWQAKDSARRKAVKRARRELAVAQ